MMKKITSKILKAGKEISFANDVKYLSAEISYSDHLNKFCIWFNGRLFTFSSLQGLKGKLEKLINKYELV